MDTSQIIISGTVSKDEQNVEIGKLSESITPKITQEVEESKVPHDPHIEANSYSLRKLPKQSIPKRCVIIVPPLYLDQDVQSKLMEMNEGKLLELDWHEMNKISQEDNINVVCKFMTTKDKSLLGANTFFLIAGFDEETKIATLKKLESAAKTNDLSQYMKQETAFVTSKEKQKTLETFWRHVRAFVETMAKEHPDNYCELHLSKAGEIVDKVEFAFEKLRDIQATLSAEQIAAVKAPINKVVAEKKMAVFLIPIGMPGMGKSTFLNLIKYRLEEKGCPVTVISADKIRKEQMRKVMKKYPDLAENDAFKLVVSSTSIQIDKDIADAIKKTDTLPQMTHIILLDRNHVPTALGGALNAVRKQRGEDTKCGVKTIVINPHSATDFRTHTSTFPFSLMFFLTCLHRAICRKDHETLKGPGIQHIQVLLGFFKQYKDYRLREGYLKALKVKFLMEVPFIHEDVEVEKKLPEALVTSFKALLNTVEDPEEEKIIAFMNEFDKSGFEPKNLDMNIIVEKVLDDLNKHFSLF